MQKCKSDAAYVVAVFLESISNLIFLVLMFTFFRPKLICDTNTPFPFPRKGIHRV